MFNNQIIAGAAGQGGSFYPYSIDQSLRFNDNDSAKLYFDPTTDGNKQVWTFSAWVKRGNLGLNYTTFFSGQNSSGHQTDIRFDSADQLRVVTAGASLTMDFKTNRVFRDVGSFYHIVVAVDTTDATLLNRVKIYVNGVQETSLATTTCTQNSNCILNTASNQTTNVGALGYTTTVTKEFDGYMSEVHFVDGTQYAASDFGETINGIWVPKAYSGSYGTNGFYLSFADSSAIGDDLSGNTNDFTANNLAASDVVPDSPTNNFATWNPLDNHNYNAPSEGNLRALTAGNNGTQNSTFAVSSGKCYFEVRNGTAGSGSLARMVGIAKEDTNITSTPYSNSDCYLYYSGDGTKYNGSSASYGDSWDADGDIIGVALDMDNGAIWFSKNGTWQNSATAAEIAAGTTTNAAFTGLSGTYVMMVSKTGGTSSNDPHHANFGQDSTFAGDETAGGNADDNGIGDFAYAPPSGFLALCSANLPEPTISPNAEEQADDYFSTTLWTGNGTDATNITTTNKPEFVWIKSRNLTKSHQLADIVRGGNKRLSSDVTNAEGTETNRIQGFGSNFFTLGTENSVNGSGNTYVGWSWTAGGTAVSNTDGSITSSVSAAPDAGFSIATWTGTGSAGATVGHGLGAVPDVMIVKKRAGGTAYGWAVWHKDANDNSTDFLQLDSTAAQADQDMWNDTDPTSTVLSLGANNYTNYPSGATYVGYFFKGIDGYSAFGSYVGNGSADGPFVYTGHAVKWLLVKNINNAATSWWILDTERSTFNVMNDFLFPNLSNAESASTVLFADFLSNGFKIRNGTYGETNASGNTYIYLAFAEAPFKYANAR